MSYGGRLFKKVLKCIFYKRNPIKLSKDKKEDFKLMKKFPVKKSTHEDKRKM